MERQFKTEFTDYEAVVSFVKYFNSLDVFYLNDFFEGIRDLSESKSNKTHLLKYLKDEGYIQFAGVGRKKTIATKNLHSAVQSSQEKKYIRVDTLPLPPQKTNEL